ncbi:hypothetical protein [Microbacterium sp. Leaf179]|uniref:hypothetical protein n=1 Tax=Microbacterium sp. Leaf179 TaxID=1736288 RepID=UPI0006F30389|nr:hypothetical protein [Microbacterium sp. Leaf179]KQR86689.1 hypothetical protein ASF96_10200 [Microbacterium sp. Leaf179]
MMQEINLNEALATIRRVAFYMKPATTDTAVVRTAKVGFRLSALLMLVTVATVAVAQPDQSLAGG